MTWSAKSDPCVPSAGRRRGVGKDEPDPGRQHDERDEEGADRPLAVPQHEEQECDAEHPAEEGDGSAERAIRDRPEHAGADEQVAKVEREAGGHERRRQPRGARARDHENPNRRGLRGRVARDREPSVEMGRHPRPMLAGAAGRNTIRPMGDFERVRRSFPLGNGSTGRLYSLPELERAGLGAIRRLPVSIRLVLESLLRNCDGKRVKADDVRALAAWKPRAERTEEIPFVVARIVLQDFTGVPLLVDLAAMRSAVGRAGQESRRSSSRSCRSIWWSTTPCRWISPVSADALAAQPGDGIQAQPRALPVPEVGHAGVRHVQGRAARHRHRPPGQPRISRQGRARRRTAFIIPTRSSAPIRTRR